MGVICISCRTNMGFNYNINMGIKQKRIDAIWDLLEEKLGGTDEMDLITELVELNIEVEANCNQ